LAGKVVTFDLITNNHCFHIPFDNELSVNEADRIYHERNRKC